LIVVSLEAASQWGRRGVKKEEGGISARLSHSEEEVLTPCWDEAITQRSGTDYTGRALGLQRGARREEEEGDVATEQKEEKSKRGACKKLRCLDFSLEIVEHRISASGGGERNPVQRGRG